MSAKIILTIIEGKLSGRQYTFDSRTSCIIGRAEDCNLQLPNDKEHSTISRYHCLLDINPPNVRIRDFGSKNGTYVNKQKIGQRQANQTPEESININFPEYDLQNEDKIKLGKTIFQISIERDIEQIKISNLKLPQTGVEWNSTEPPNLLERIKGLLGLANAGDTELLSIHGYNIVGLLGKGGCGEVYLARHENSGEMVALKAMLPAIAANENALKMFSREMANTKVLQHPNVINLIDYGYSEGIFFFTMEHCSGGSVQKLMEQQDGCLTIDVAAAIILQLLEGLEYTHNAEIPYVKLADGSFGKGKGLVHRDLKPGNIFLSKVSDRICVKIGDYGLSKAFDLAGLSGQSLTGSVAGTAIFTPRQQLLNFKYVQPEVDVWAAAACLYYMLTCAYPREFTGDDPWLEVLQNDPVPILERNPNIPEGLAKVVDLALIEKPEIYFKSATQFKQALLDVL